MPADLETLCKEARQLFRTGKYQLAAEFFEKAIKLDPDQAETHDSVAIAYFALKQYDKAIEHFQRTSQLRPMDPKPLINLGAVYNRKEEFTKAADVLKKAITRDGKAVEAYYNLGIAYRGLKQPAMAVSSYKEALRINPRMLDALQNLGNTYLEMNNPKAAAEQYKKALEIDEGFERAQRGLARAEEAQSQAKAAFNPFGRLVAESPMKQMKSDVGAKKLSSEEKLADRQFLRRAMIEIQAATKQLQEHLHNTLLEDLTQLNRGIQKSQRDVNKMVYSASEEFQASVKRFQGLHLEIQRLTKDLRTHEDRLKT